jgi:hypothetical protein
MSTSEGKDCWASGAVYEPYVGRWSRLVAHEFLQQVTVRAIDVATPFRTFEEYCSLFLGGQGPAPGYGRSLPPERQEQLRASLESTLPRAPDGSIPLIARAWAVRGVRTNEC